MPLVLDAGPRSEDDGEPRFLDAARDRLLWKRPAPEVYDAISGLRTDLPPLPRRHRPRRRRRLRSVPRGTPDAAAEPYLLLEGDVTAARANRALDSPVRNWVVEHVGRVRIDERALARLAARGVRWSVLWPVELRGIVDVKVADAKAPRRRRVSRAASAPTSRAR